MKEQNVNNTDKLFETLIKSVPDYGTRIEKSVEKGEIKATKLYKHLFKGQEKPSYSVMWGQDFTRKLGYKIDPNVKSITTWHEGENGNISEFPETRVAFTRVSPNGKFFEQLESMDLSVNDSGEVVETDEVKAFLTGYEAAFKDNFKNVRIALKKSNTPIILPQDKVLIQTGRESLSELMERLAESQVTRYPADSENAGEIVKPVTYRRWYVADNEADKVSMMPNPYIPQSIQAELQTQEGQETEISI